MWRSKTISRAISLFVLVPSLCLAQEQTDSDNLINRSRWVQFDVICGRITAYRAQLNQSKSASFSQPECGIHESYSVSNELGNPSVSFERTDPQQHVTIDFTDGNQLEVFREPRGQSVEPTVHFLQPKTGPLTLSVTNSQSHQEYQGASIWHLLLAEKAVCCKQLVPILEMLRPDWRLTGSVECLEQQLIERPLSLPIVQSSCVNQLVEQLGSEVFQERQAADRQLRQLGQSVVPCLDRYDRHALSAEQRLRLRQIRFSLASDAEDTPRRAAFRLASDPSIWLILMAHDDPAKSRIAAGQLERICQKTLRFDPSAIRAQRMAYIERIHSMLQLD